MQVLSRKHRVRKRQMGSGKACTAANPSGQLQEIDHQFRWSHVNLPWSAGAHLQIAIVSRLWLLSSTQFGLTKRVRWAPCLWLSVCWRPDMRRSILCSCKPRRSLYSQKPYPLSVPLHRAAESSKISHSERYGNISCYQLLPCSQLFTLQSQIH